MSELRLVHWNGALRVLAYIKGSPGKGLIYSKHGHLNIHAYSHSSYANDKADRRSTSGYCTYVGGNLVTWRSKKQNVVSKSSAEAEYRSMSQTAGELVWLRSFLTGFGILTHGLMSMYCDNQAAIYIASNDTFHERTKHIEVDCHYVRELVERGVISTPYMKSYEQLADIFTKGLNSGTFQYLCNKLGLFDLYSPA